MKIAFDEHVAPKVANAIRALSGEKGMLRAEIVSAREYAPAQKGTGDVYWLEKFAGEGGEVIVSGDARMRGRPHEQLALRKAGFIVFFFARRWNNMDGYNKTAMLVRWWPFILKKIETATPGQMFEIPCSWRGAQLKEVTPHRRRKPGAKPRRPLATKRATPTARLGAQASDPTED